jgi:hypothetical protein
MRSATDCDKLKLIFEHICVLVMKILDFFSLGLVLRDSISSRIYIQILHLISSRFISSWLIKKFEKWSHLARRNLVFMTTMYSIRFCLKTTVLDQND